MSPLRQRLAHAALRSRSWSRAFGQRASAALQRRGPFHRLLRRLHRYSRRHPVSVNQWDVQYAGDDYRERLDSISEVAHHMVIVGYLANAGPTRPKVLDIGCGHGRLLQLLAGIDFSDYLGVDWSEQAIQRARSRAIPNTRFEVADMDHWGTTERFDAIILDECLYYSANDPRETFERVLGWLAEDGIVIVSMFRGLGVRYIWSVILSGPVEEVAGCAVKDGMRGKIWDVKALRRRPRE
jgi:SAM-dependent methyltransferase